MDNFADRLLAAIAQKGNPCTIGLDPRLDLIPSFVIDEIRHLPTDDAIRGAIAGFHRRIIEQVAPLVPVVKLQSAFYEQYGIPGLLAFQDTIECARSHDLIVVVDAKRNDIDSTARAYADAFLGAADVFGAPRPAFDVDALTVNGYLGEDSLEPFARVCAEYGRGIFTLVRTSNPGADDLQGQKLETGTVADRMAGFVDRVGSGLVGRSGYSSVGAVVGATWPQEAEKLRGLMPRAIILVPGYGHQGGTGDGAAPNFNTDGLGAIVSSSRSATYPTGAEANASAAAYAAWLDATTRAMVVDVAAGAKARSQGSVASSLDA